MGNYLPFIAFVLVIIGLITFAARARRRQAYAQTVRAENISVGTEVMTTSGLYGIVVARNDEESVQLSIAPGVEVKWAFAALRDVASLPTAYRTAEANDEVRPSLHKSERTDPAGGLDPNP